MLRATLKSMLSRKLRLTLSTVAVVLGVMFVSGALVLTDVLGRSFENLFTGIYAYTDIEVSKKSDVPTFSGQPAPVNLPAADVAKAGAVAGVAKATGVVFTDGARIIGTNNKVVLANGGGAPRYGANWVGESELVKLRDGRGPTKDDEIVISANLAKTTGYQLGQQVGILAPFAPSKQVFTLVGIFGYPGGRDSLAGETLMFFTEPTAQRLMLGAPNVYNNIDITVANDADVNAVRDHLVTAFGPDYQVQTGAELAAENASNVKQGLNYFSYLLLGFAGVALFVGIFLILNTFSIIVAQRTRELALFRAIGAARGQVIGSVLIEAVLVGLFASVVGLAAGVGVGALLGRFMGGLLSGGQLQLAGLSVPLGAIIAAFAVGVGITVIAALMPALRASRIAPVAAMREAATPDRPLTPLTISGAAVLAVGAGLLSLGLTGNLGRANLWGVLGGLLTSFVGVALLTPIVSRPVVALLGRALSWSAAGQLGRGNSARNPRRTAITAAALMVSIALVTGISVIFSSVRASTVEAIDTGLNADLIIAGELAAGGIGAIDPAALDKIRHLPSVGSAVGLYVDAVNIDGRDEFVSGADDPEAAVQMFRIEATDGTLVPLRTGNIIVDDRTAADRGLHPGSTVQVKFSRGQTRTLTVQGIYRRNAVTNGFLFAPADMASSFQPAPVQAFVAVANGADVNATLTSVNEILADSPEVSAKKLDDYVAQQAQVFTIILVFVQVLLGLAMLIAVLGIINTLALSMIERTRELGLLRAVGMTRGQVMWMVTVESIVISVFGALLGIAVGVGLGSAVFQALRSQGFTELAFPWVLMGGYVVASVLVGLAAGIIPAVRAARLDVLRAIAYE